MAGDVDGDVYGYIAVQRRRIAELEAEVERLLAVNQHLRRTTSPDRKRPLARYGA